jgi:predicted dehydrogenase
VSEEKVGFVRMGEATGPIGEIPSLGIGMLGYAFMGKAHVNAYKKMPYFFWPPPATPRLVAIAGRSESALAEAARRYGFERHFTDWRRLIEDEDVQVLDNGGPNDMHAEPCIAAAEAGKHVICEKPLGRTAAESKSMLDAVEKAGVKHVCAFNYRFVPAVRLARQIIDRGDLGQIYHFRARYLQEWGDDPELARVWRFDKAQAGSGSLGDLGAHIIDLARYLVGEPKAVSGITRTFLKERPAGDGSNRRETVDVDDAFESIVEYENGAIGTLEATRFAKGRKNSNTFEINGSRGSIAFNLERLNELEVYLPEQGDRDSQGFRTVIVSESYHPFWKAWWPHGHMIGWEHTFVHEIEHFFNAIVGGHDIGPHGATFVDGYRAAVVCDAIEASARDGGSRIEITY